jgi:hypothetical protein
MLLWINFGQPHPKGHTGIYTSGSFNFGGWNRKSGSQPTYLKVETFVGEVKSTRSVRGDFCFNSTTDVRNSRSEGCRVSSWFILPREIERTLVRGATCRGSGVWVGPRQTFGKREDVDRQVRFPRSGVRFRPKERKCCSRLKELLPSRGEASRRAVVKMAANSWNVGDPCLAVYHEDGQSYKAVVSALKSDGSQVSRAGREVRGGRVFLAFLYRQTALVTFVEYGNEQVTRLEDLTRAPEHTGRRVRASEVGRLVQFSLFILDPQVIEDAVKEW